MRRRTLTIPVYRFAVRSGPVTLFVVEGGLTSPPPRKNGAFVVDVERIAEEILREYRQAA